MKNFIGFDHPTCRLVLWFFEGQLYKKASSLQFEKKPICAYWFKKQFLIWTVFLKCSFVYSINEIENLTQIHWTIKPCSHLYYCI
jgi:hypothetical protein